MNKINKKGTLTNYKKAFDGKSTNRISSHLGIDVDGAFVGFSGGLD
jgi:hypothetical protein